MRLRSAQIENCQFSLGNFQSPWTMRTSPLFITIILLALTARISFAADPAWRHLSSTNGALPVPGASTQQTGALVVDLDRDGTNDFVLSFRQKAPALIWYRRKPTGRDRYVIEQEFLTVEAGGAFYDIDGDGDPDLVFGGDW